MKKTSRYRDLSEIEKKEYIEKNKKRIALAREENKIKLLSFSVDSETYDEFQKAYKSLKARGMVKTKIGLLKLWISQENRGGC